MEKEGSKQENNPRIPSAVFVDDVDKFMEKSENSSVEDVLKRLDEQHSKYKFFEYNLITKRKRLQSQLPDLENTLEMIKTMKAHKGQQLKTDFLLSDDVYAKAHIQATDNVYLWLGANVMLEYNLDDATELISRNIQLATDNMGQVDDDLDFLRDQFTTTEVNMARVYNWDVKRRQAAKAKQ
ncbi:prefoldin subunit 3 [Rhopalosiphum maidis]|uniref:prefoldin subunit 3 n=1 Tax=Rhopalosiphum maidis TaxID=43146 RepID=UPI000EFF4D80|nr:prefoldin subunit 3 [Rhopalosiphum maidis]XP_060835393.1 prefoldin subunit 3 [Rhopalosiphum padi]